MLVHLKASRDRQLWRGWVAGGHGIRLGATGHPEPAARVPRGATRLFLWLGLGCFAVVGCWGCSGLVTGTIRRRRRGRALRMFRPNRVEAIGRLLRWLAAARGRAAGGAFGGLGSAFTRRAELKAEQAVAVLRSELTPHLARMMKDRLVWTLMTSGRDC
jgi:hypothetical protein